MSSLRRIAASRANGKKSQGPVTPEGKARSAANARPTHGLSSPDRAGHSVILRNENRDEFMLLYGSLVGEHAPVTATEYLTVHEMATTTWRLNRALTMETALLDLQMDDMLDKVEQDYESIDESTRLALGFRELADKSPAFSVLLRYEARLTRQVDRCLKRLSTLRAERVDMTIPDEIEEIPAEPSPKNEHSLNEKNDNQHGNSAPPGPPDPAPHPTPEPAVAPAAPTPELEALPESHGPEDPDCPSAPCAPLPRAA
jgi:hypothetical protein